jgi:hypothetical protein
VIEPRAQDIEWIVCERTTRWASALRMQLVEGGIPHRIRELRHLSELDAELAERPTAVAAIEVHRGNFAELLSWLPNDAERHPRARAVVLVDRTLSEHSAEVCDALVEAGAQAVATSPRRLEAIVACGARHAAIAEKTGPNASLADRVQASLPWQAAGSQVGWEARP